MGRRSSSQLPDVRPELTAIEAQMAIDEAALAAMGGAMAQSIILLTDANGEVAWTFPTAFGVGIVPVLSADVIATSNQPYSVRQLALNNTGLSLRVLGAAAVTILTISVLAALTPVGAGVPVHITARRPT